MTLSTVVVTQPRFESFEDYLAYTDDNNRLYELFNGELILVPPESGFNIGIATNLLIYFAQIAFSQYSQITNGTARFSRRSS